MSSEGILQELIRFVSETGRLPKPDEPDLRDLVDSAIKHFGSLENALKVAGLLTPNDKTTRAIRVRQISLARTRASRASVWSEYPKDYFLDFLDLGRDSSRYHSPTPIGTPTWWERRANTQYACSTCRKPIQKGERYIGRRKLRPGVRGIYGHRGTYSTDYYHITCLLRKAKSEVEKSIGHTNDEISENEKEITDYMTEISMKREHIQACRTAIQHAAENYKQAGSWRKIGKWFGTQYTSWVKTRQILRLEREMAHIENIEIPKRKTHITSLKGRVDSFQRKLDEIDTRLNELASH
jgi:hypothetical protein